MPRLIISSGSGSDPGRTVDLGTDSVSIGRDASNTIPLEHEGKASRRHCLVMPLDGGAYEVVDNQSTNGTRVNGNPIQRRQLRHGDVIEVGLTKLKFEDARAVATGEASACYLEWTAGDKKGERVPLAASRVSFGRRETNTVVLVDKMTSSHHAEITKDLNGYTLRDLGSTNGTLVNGAPITETSLTHGARVRIGGSKFVFKDPSMADVEVALEGVEEDDGGWGMMSELDVSKGGGGAGGVIAAVVLIGGLAAGAFFLGSRPSEATTVAADSANLLTDGLFDGEDALAWVVDDGVPATVERATTGGRPGRGATLVVRHDGRGAGRGIVRYVENLDVSPGTSYRVSGYAKRDGAAPAYLAVQWTRGGNVATGATAVTQLIPVGSPEKAGTWAAFEREVRRPSWARIARLVAVVSPETSLRLDDLRLEPSAGAAPPELPGLRGFEAALAATGGLDAKRTATVLFVGATPWAKTADGRVLGGTDAFLPSGPAKVVDAGVEVDGRLVDDQGSMPAKVTWQAAPNGITATVTVEGAAACGLAADFPRAHLEEGLGVLAAAGAKKIAPQAGASVDGARRVLLGDNRDAADSNRPPTLVAFDVVGDAAGTATTAEASDPGLARLVVSVAGGAATVRIVTDFDAERQQAKGELQQALALAQATPGEGLGALDSVAQRYPFDDDVVRRAREAAQKLRDVAASDLARLSEAIARHRVFGDLPSLVDAETRAAQLAAQFPGGTGQLEQSIRASKADVVADRAAYELTRAAPEVRRLVRLAELLESEQPPTAGDPDLKVLALAYYDTVVRRYGDLEQAVVEGANADVVQKLQQARRQRDALRKDSAVASRYPAD